MKVIIVKKKAHEILVKPDSGVIDSLVCSLKRCIIANVFYIEKGIDYQVIPVKENYSLVEMVQSAKSLSHIRKTNSTIQDFLLAENPHETIFNLRQAFLETLAFESIFGYGIGLGDRHSGNLLVNSQGSLVNIDLNYILGKETGMRTCLGTSKIKITEDMIHMLGGKKHVNFKKFNLLSQDIFNVLREHIRLIHLFIYKPVVEHLDYVSQENYVTHFNRTLCPSESIRKAIYFIEDKLNQSSSSGAQTSEHVLDTLHTTIHGVFKKIFY